jgi:hypothetical protein
MGGSTENHAHTFCHAVTILWQWISWPIRRALGKSHNERLANFTVLMTVATFIVAGAAIIQLWEFKSQERRQLRAYVGVKPVGQLNLSSGVTLAQPFSIKNFGLSPAFNVREDSAVVMLPYPLKGSFNMGKQLPSTEISKVTIFPGEAFPFTASSLHTITDSDIGEVIDGKRSRLFVAAQLTYDDIFGAHHYTHVCALYGGGKQVISYCDRYNDTDDDTN